MSQNSMKPEQDRVKTLLTDTVTLLCKNGLTYQSELKVQGLIGISVDSEIFLVHINELFGDAIGGVGLTLSKESDAQMMDNEERRSPKKRRRKRRSSRDSYDSEDNDDGGHSSFTDSPSTSSLPGNIQIKKEAEDIICIDDTGGKAGDDRNAMRQTYSGFSLQDAQRGFQNFDQMGTDSSGHEAKHRRKNNDGSSPYVTGMLSNQTATSTDSQNASDQSWDSSQIQLSADGQVMLDQSAAGVSSWEGQPGSQGSSQMQSDESLSGHHPKPMKTEPAPQISTSICGIQSRKELLKGASGPLYAIAVNPDDLTSCTATTAPPVEQGMDYSATHLQADHLQRRRPINSADKSFHCKQPGCDKSYYSAGNLWYHEVHKHGRRQKRFFKKNCN